MKSIKHKSLIKFQEVDHKLEPLFVYPGVFFDEILKPQGIEEDNINDHLAKIDKNNRRIFFTEIMKYQEKIRDLFQRAEMFNSEPLMKKYFALKSFYHILVDFLLEVLTYLYYWKLYLFHEANEKNYKKLFGEESKGFNFSFDKAFEYTLKLEENIRKHFENFVNEEFPDPNIEAAVYGETNQKHTHKIKHKKHKKHKKSHKTTSENDMKKDIE